MSVVTTLLTYIVAGIAEIAGCFAFWSWLRSARSVLWVIPGILSLLFFAYLLTRIDSDSAGRAFAAYGGVYIVASLCWMVVVEGRSADRWDAIGAGLCVLGAMVIIFGPRNG